MTLLSRFILRPLNRIIRRFDCSFDRSRDLSDTKLGIMLATSRVIAEWNLAAGIGKPSLLISLHILLGYWCISLSVVI